MSIRTLLVAAVIPFSMLQPVVEAAGEVAQSTHSTGAISQEWQSGRARGQSVSTTGRTGTCSDYSMSFGGDDFVRGEERLAIAGHRLSVSASENGGISLLRSRTGEFSVLACKAASGETLAEARDLLAQITLQERGGVVEVAAPDANGWNVQLIIGVPDGATVDANAQNGPLSVAGIDATLVARVVNGPLSLTNSRGTIQARAINGPLSLAGMSGHVEASVKNGPLTVRLDDSAWIGGELRTSVENGPLTVSVPSGYGSGVVVDMRGHGPFACSLPECSSLQPPRGHRGPWRPREVSLGSGATNVFIQGGNGPITISEGR